MRVQKLKGGTRAPGTHDIAISLSVCLYLSVCLSGCLSIVPLLPMDICKQHLCGCVCVHVACAKPSAMQREQRESARTRRKD